MTKGSFVAYYRVSTTKQGQSGLGLDAQRETVRAFLNGGDWHLAGEFTEVESGRSVTRPELAKALSLCRAMGAALVVAKVDRLTRSVAFLSTLLEAGVEVRFCDLPVIEGPTGRFMLTQLAAVAELEAGLIGDRTRKALAAAKARGTKLGGWRGQSTPSPEDRAKALAARRVKAQSKASDLMGPVLDARIALGGPSASLNAIAKELTRRGVKTPAGATTWHARQVARLLGKGCGG